MHSLGSSAHTSLTYDESLWKQAVNIDIQCILWTANGSYAVKTPKDEVTCNITKNWKFGHVSLKTRDFEIKLENVRQPLKTGVSRSIWEGWNVCYIILIVCTHDDCPTPEKKTLDIGYWMVDHRVLDENDNEKNLKLTFPNSWNKNASSATIAICRRNKSLRKFLFI